MLVKKLHYTLLRLDAARMRYWPQFGFEVLPCFLTVPYIMHYLERLFYARHLEQLVLRTVYKQSRLRACQAGYVGIV